jgi:hypothetical protein
MKKLFIFLAMIIFQTGLIAQTTNKNIIIEKVAPLFHANGTGAVLRLYNTTFTESNGKISISNNITAPNLLQGYTTTVTTTGTATLTVSSNYLQFFTGSTTHIVVLPVTSTLALGHQFLIVNNSTSAVTVNSSGGNAVVILASGTWARITCILASGTDAASWNSVYNGIGITSAKKLTVNNTLTFIGTDATSMTFPTTSATLARIDAANSFTGDQTITGNVLNVTSLGIGTVTPLHKFVVTSTRAVNLNTMNLVESDINKNRTTVAQARDTSSLNLWYTYTGSPLLTMTDKNGTVAFRADSVGIGIGTGVAQHRLVVLTDPLTKLNAFNFVNTVNKLRDTPQQASDTSSFNMSFSTTGSPMLSLKGKTGSTLLYVDSLGINITGNDGLVLSGAGTYWDDLMFPSHSLKSVGTAAKPDYDVVGQTLDFPEDTTEAIGFAVQMPHDWKEGSTIWPHVHWLRESADSVDWTFRYKWFNIGAALPATWTQKKLSHNTQTWTSGTIHEMSRVVDAVGISGSGKTISSMLVIKFYRNSDPYTGDAKLLELDIHYEKDGLGSRTESAK